MSGKTEAGKPSSEPRGASRPANTGKLNGGFQIWASIAKHCPDKPLNVWPLLYGDGIGIDPDERIELWPI